MTEQTSHSAQTSERDPILTLAEFTIPLPLRCHHCDRRLPKTTRMQRNGPYVIALCPNCGLLTPFKLEAA